MVVDGSVIGHHSLTFFLVASLRIPLEEMPLPLSVHIMGVCFPCPSLWNPGVGIWLKFCKWDHWIPWWQPGYPGWCLCPAGTVKGIPLSASAAGLVGCEHPVHLSGSGAGREETDLAQAFGSNYICLFLGFPAPGTSQFLEPTHSF